MQIDAVVFDTDGVITRTAAVHFGAWRRLFDELLQGPLAQGATDRSPFTDDDYRRYVDGMARYDGVARFLVARGIELPLGTPADPPGHPTVCGLGNQKNEAFLAELDTRGVEPFAGTVRFVQALKDRGIAVAAISASESCEAVLHQAGVDQLFDVRVDGVDAARLGLPGKPDPAMFLEAAARLGVAPARTAVVEDAVAGVEAGRAGGFALVVGVDRTSHPEALAAAHVVVPDLADLEVTAAGIVPSRHPRQPLTDLTSALEDPEVARRLAQRRPAVFLDYDGTLTPIVDRPEMARLGDEARAALARLATRCTVAILSGRGLDDVRDLVAVDSLWYGGSHGLELRSPEGVHHEPEGAADLEWDKGRALRFAMEVTGSHPPEVLPIYVGDDVTDEDAFLEVRAEGLGIVVGSQLSETAALHHLADPTEVCQMLSRLADDLEDRPS